MAAVPLLRTKLFIPPLRAEWVSRPRLMRRLAEATKHPLTLISAPAGFGKTTLLAEWVDNLRLDATQKNQIVNHKSEIENRIAWLSLDEGDNDTPRFWSYIIAALQTLQTDLGSSALSVLESPQSPPVQSVLTLLLNDLASLANPITLILDDYHMVETQAIHEGLTFLLDHIPSQLRLIITSRADPFLPMARWRARGQLSELRADDLRFTPDEAAVFLNEVMGLSLSAVDVAALEGHTEGWIAGLQLAALSMQGRQDVAGFIEAFTGSHRFILDYLADEVLGQRPKGTENFLLQTAILDRLCGPLCDAVTGRNDGQMTLEQLERANLFIVSLDDQRCWYRYHHLFTDVLRQRLISRTTADVIATLHHRASAWYEAAGLADEAIRHALAGLDIERAVQLINQAASAALLKGEWKTLLGWLEALPDDVVRTSIELATYAGWALIWMGQTERAESYAQSASQGIATDAAPLSRGRLLSLLAYLALRRQKNTDALALANQALELIGETDPFLRSLSLYTLVQAQRASNDISGAINNLYQAIQIDEQLGPWLTTMSFIALLALELSGQGRRREAVALCHRTIKQYVDRQGQPLPVACFAYAALGRLEYEANELVRAESHLNQARELCQRLAMPLGILAINTTRAFVQAAQGNVHLALATVQEAQQIATQINAAEYIASYTAYEAELQLRQGNITAAEHWAESITLSASGPFSPPHVAEHFVYIRLLLAQHRYQLAQTVLAKLEHWAHEIGCNGHLVNIYVLQAHAANACGQMTKAINYLRQALQLAEPEGYIRVFLDEGQPIVVLLRRMNRLPEDSRLKAYIHQLLVAFGENIEDEMRAMKADEVSMPSSSQSLVEPLSQRELELLLLVADGYSNKEVAQELVIAVGTAKKHLNNIFGKLGVSNRTQAVARARELGLL